MLFTKVLAKNVMELQLQEGALLTYVDTFTTSKMKNSGKKHWDYFELSGQMTL